MHAPTQILAGILIGRVFRWRDYPIPALVCTVIVGLFTHGLLDQIGRLTYSCPEIAMDDPFWLGFHLVVLLISLALLYVFWSDYRMAIVVMLLPDIDWVMLYTSSMLGGSIPFYHEPWIHEGIYWVFNHTIPLCYLSNLPDWRWLPIACLVEVGLCWVIWMVYRYVRDYRRNIHFK